MSHSFARASIADVFPRGHHLTSNRAWLACGSTALQTAVSQPYRARRPQASDHCMKYRHQWIDRQPVCCYVEPTISDINQWTMVMQRSAVNNWSSSVVSTLTGILSKPWTAPRGHLSSERSIVLSRLWFRFDLVCTEEVTLQDTRKVQLLLLAFRFQTLTFTPVPWWWSAVNSVTT